MGDQGYNDEAGMPWAGGVRAADLSMALEPLVERVEVMPLTDPVLWGKEIEDERYLLLADDMRALCPNGPGTVERVATV